jgi:hypothetical protein
MATKGEGDLLGQDRRKGDADAATLALSSGRGEGEGVAASASREAEAFSEADTSGLSGVESSDGG